MSGPYAQPPGPQAARLRQRKFQLLARFPIPADLLPGSLSQSFLRCGKAACHCARPGNAGHPVWTLTFMLRGKKHAQHIPQARVSEVRRRAEAGCQFPAAVREVLAINAQPLVLARRQRRPWP